MSNVAPQDEWASKKLAEEELHKKTSAGSIEQLVIVGIERWKRGRTFKVASIGDICDHINSETAKPTWHEVSAEQVPCEQGQQRTQGFKLFVDFDRQAYVGQVFTTVDGAAVALTLTKLLTQGYVLATGEAPERVLVYDSSSGGKLSFHAVAVGRKGFASLRQVAIVVAAALECTEDMDLLMIATSEKTTCAVDFSPYTSGSLRLLGCTKTNTARIKRLGWVNGLVCSPRHEYTKTDVCDSLVFTHTNTDGEDLITSLPGEVEEAAERLREVFATHHGLYVTYPVVRSTSVWAGVRGGSNAGATGSIGVRSMWGTGMQPVLTPMPEGHSAEWNQTVMELAHRVYDIHGCDYPLFERHSPPYDQQVLHVDRTGKCPEPLMDTRLSDFSLMIRTGNHFCYRRGPNGGKHNSNTVYIIAQFGALPYKYRLWDRSGNHCQHAEWMTINLENCNVMKALIAGCTYKDTEEA
jgi:hypothetical protein